LLKYLLISSILSLIILVASQYTRRHMHPFEMMTNWLFSSALLFIWSNIIELNQKWIEVENAKTVFWSLTFYRLFIIPGVTIWLLFVYSSKTINPIYKQMCTILWFLVLIGIQFFHEFLGLIQFKQWNVYFSFLEWFSFWLLTVGIWGSFRLLLKKEEVF
jgi:hypothetical protein